MKWLRKFELFKESKSEKIGNYSTKNLIYEICTAMILLNHTFLDNILDKGMKARYSENSQVFLTDLKNLLLTKNRLKFGRFVEGKCVEDDASKVNGVFESVQFNIEDDWSKLVNARICARNIIDKLLPDEKLESDKIESIYWIGTNKDKEHDEDIVVELTDGRQFSFYLNKNISAQKSASFNLFADDLIGGSYEQLFNEEYLRKWDKLTQEWVRIIYEGSHKNIQQQIEKFIDTNRIDTISYFEYFDIRHRDPRYKHLGEYMREFDDNILKFSDLMNKIWKNRDACLLDVNRSYNEWMETKIYVLNSRILEHLLTSALKSNSSNDIIKKDGDNLKLAEGVVKMKLVKTMVEKLGCMERPIYFLGGHGNQFTQVPSRDFFRKYYDDMTVKFDYHVKFAVDGEEEENNDFKFKVILELEDTTLIEMLVSVKFSGGEFSGKLGAKYKFVLSDDFNYRVSQKISGQNEEV